MRQISPWDFLVSGGGYALWLPTWWIRIRELLWLGTVQLLARVVLLFLQKCHRISSSFEIYFNDFQVDRGPTLLRG